MRRETAEQKAAREGIDKIRRNGFNPGDDKVNKLIRKHGPERAFQIMRLTADFDRTITPYH